MKKTKKFLSILLCVSLFFSMQVFALNFPDVAEDNNNGEAIDVLSSLGIIKGYEDGQFKPDKEVTRAELTSLLMRLLNLSITGTEVADSGYTDVANNHWAVYDIKTASNMGIIKGFGDGTFGPEAPVTFEQAVKMVVAMLGYESVAIDKGGWPEGYVTQGRDLGLIKNAEMAQTQPAPRKIIAQILYNALEVDLMEKKNGEESYYINQGHNLLTDYMKISKVTGMVTANSTTRLDNNESQLPEDKIEITAGGIVKDYKVGNFEEIKDMVGLSVIAYVKYDEYNVNQVIQHFMSKSELNEVVIAPKDVNIFNAANISVTNETTGRTINYKLSDNAVYMYNGKNIAKNDLFSNNLHIPTIGSIKIIDSGSGYDYVEIESYKNYLVKSVDTSEYLVYVDNTVGDTNVSSIKVPVDDKLDYVVSIKKGTSNLTLSGIKKGNIISVKQTIPTLQAGIQNIGILVSDTKKTGKITEEGTDYVVLDSKQYTISPFIQGTDLANKIVYNASGTFYIDAFDSIAYAEFSTGNTYKYGYVINAGIKTSGDGNEANIRLFDYTSGSSVLYDFYQRVTVDGTPTTNMQDVMTALLNGATTVGYNNDAVNYTYAQPIKYVLNNQGKIIEIITVNSATDKSMNVIYADNDGKAKYYSTNKYFSLDSGNKLVDSKTIVFEVPNDRFSANDYAKRTYSNFKNNFTYDVLVIGESESGAANIVIAYEPNVEKDVNYSTPTYIVKDMKDVLVSDELKTQLTLINFQNGNEATAYCPVANKSYIANVEIGDVIRFGKDTNGDINENVYVYLDISAAKAGSTPELITTNTAQDKAKLTTPSAYPLRKVMMNTNYEYLAPNRKISSFDTYAFIFGTPYSITESGLEFTDLVPNESGFDVDSDTDNILDKPTDTINLTVSSSTMFFTINSSNEITATKGSGEDNNVLGTILSYKDHPDKWDYVYTYIVDESLKAVYVIKTNN